MMMSILLVLVQFPGCWAANCSSRPWVGKTATMKYNSELFSLRDIMSWWCLLKFYIQLHILFWHSPILQQKAACGIVSKFKLMLSTFMMRPQVRVESSWAYITFIRCICVSGKSDPIKVIFSKCDCVMISKESLSCQKWMYFRKHNKYLLWVGNWCFGFFWQKPQSCHAETSSWYFATFEQQLILPLSVRI